MIIPLGSSGGRQLTSTEDESRALSCSSSGGEEGPEGERRTGSVIRAQKWGLTAAECILSWWGIWHVVWRPSASSCPRHLGTGESGQAGQWGNGPGLRWWYVAAESVSGWLVVIKSLKAAHSTLTTPHLADSCWPTWEPPLHLGISLKPVISHQCQTTNSRVHWPLANTMVHTWVRHTLQHLQASESKRRTPLPH